MLQASWHAPSTSTQSWPQSAHAPHIFRCIPVTTPWGEHASHHLSLRWRSPAVLLTALTPHTAWGASVHSGQLHPPAAPAPGACHLGALVLSKFCPPAPRAAPRPTLPPSLLLCSPWNPFPSSRLRRRLAFLPASLAGLQICPLEPRPKAAGLRGALLQDLQPHPQRCCRNLLTQMALILVSARLRFLFTGLLVRGGL